MPRLERNRLLKKINKYEIREKVNPAAKTTNLPKWITAVPYDVRERGFNDAWLAYEAALNSCKNGIPATLKFRKKKHLQSITITKKNIRDNTIYTNTMGSVKHKKSLLSAGDTRLTHDSKGFYLNILEKSSNRVLADTLFGIMVIKNYSTIPCLDKQEVHRTDSIIALDPGVRTFQTSYTTNTVADIGSDACTRLYRLRKLQHRLRNKMQHVTARKRRVIKKANDRITLKIKHLVDELHWKSIKYIMRYDNVILPNFNVSKMIKRYDAIGRRRKISRRTVKEMLLLNHYKFRLRLKTKIEASNAKRLWIVNEAYTSKTCGSCGHIHEKLGGNKTFKCPNCHAVFGRDVNGARNIFLKHVNIT